jgi:tRNA-binding protein
MSDTISAEEFFRADLRVGTIRSCEPADGARNPAWRLTIDFGPELGLRRSSARLTTLYRPEDLVGRQVIGVVNLPPRRIAGFVSEVLVTGFEGLDGSVVLAAVERPVPDGTRLS